MSNELTELEGNFLPREIDEGHKWNGPQTIADGTFAGEIGTVVTGDETVTKFTYGASELVFSEASGTGTLVINGTTFLLQASY